MTSMTKFLQFAYNFVMLRVAVGLTPAPPSIGRRLSTSSTMPAEGQCPESGYRATIPAAMAEKWRARRCLESKNNPVFGVVKGDPIVIVVDKSGSMAAQFTLQEKSWTRNSFCDQELENVVNGLSEGSRFNIITYSSSANMVFPDVKYATEENKKAAIDAVRKVPASGGTNSQAALDLAYAMTTMPEQIYFLTDGKPNTPANTILASLPTVPPLSDIPVNGIVFILPGGDPVARQFMKDLADQTGGFFRAVEDDPEGTNDQTR